MSVRPIIIYCLFIPDHVVAYHKMLLKTIANRCTIFSLKFTKNRLAAGPGFVRTRAPYPALKRSPDPLAAIWGLLLREGERGKEWKGGESRERRKWKGREEMGGREKGKERRGQAGER